MNKSRKEKILELIEQKNYETQTQLVEDLCKMGYEATQATVSRDIRSLGLTKVNGTNGRKKYAAIKKPGKSGGSYATVLKEGFLSCDTAENILVIKTVSGMAMAVAAAVDDMEFEDVVGSIAGDDTIMLAVRSSEKASKLCVMLKNMVKE